jgi:hypothetical protein
MTSSYSLRQCGHLKIVGDARGARSCRTVIAVKPFRLRPSRHRVEATLHTSFSASSDAGWLAGRVSGRQCAPLVVTGWREFTSERTP